MSFLKSFAAGFASEKVNQKRAQDERDAAYQEMVEKNRLAYQNDIKKLEYQQSLKKDIMANIEQAHKDAQLEGRPVTAMDVLRATGGDATATLNYANAETALANAEQTRSNMQANQEYFGTGSQPATSPATMQAPAPIMDDNSPLDSSKDSFETEPMNSVVSSIANAPAPEQDTPEARMQFVTQSFDTAIDKLDKEIGRAKSVKNEAMATSLKEQKATLVQKRKDAMKLATTEIEGEQKVSEAELKSNLKIKENRIKDFETNTVGPAQKMSVAASERLSGAKAAYAAMNELDTGSFTPAVLAVQKLLYSAGATSDTVDQVNATMIEQWGNRQQKFADLEKLKGSISDKEQQLLAQIMTNLTNTPAQNKMILLLSTIADKRNSEFGGAMTSVLRKMEKTGQSIDYSKAWRNYVNQSDYGAELEAIIKAGSNEEDIDNLFAKVINGE